MAFSHIFRDMYRSAKNLRRPKSVFPTESNKDGLPISA